MKEFFSIIYFVLALGSGAYFWEDAEEALNQKRWAAFVFNVICLLAVGNLMHDVVSQYVDF